MNPSTPDTRCIFSVDVEDWFHILALPTTPDVAQWDTLPSRVEPNFRRMLDLFSEHRVSVTCFFLGWVAERFPTLVREAAERGHEIASHGYAHTLAYRMTHEAFATDVRRAKDVLEGITGKPVLGYRAPGFSVTEDTPWFFTKRTCRRGPDHGSPRSREATVFLRWWLFAALSLRADPADGTKGSARRATCSVLYPSTRDRPAPPAASHGSRTAVQVVRQPSHNRTQSPQNS